MATEIYKNATVSTINGTEIYMTPLKIRYLREFMKTYELVQSSGGGEDSLDGLVECVRIAMKQYYPLIKTIEDVEDSFDIATIYKILDIAANITNKESSEPIKEQAENTEGGSWETLDLVKLETEAFLLGIWKNYDELELSLSMPELFTTLESKRELDYAEKKFAAAMQGVDLDEQIGKKPEEDAWERMKARVASGGAVDSANDIVGYQGQRAAQVGFGIGMGLDYDTEI